MELLKRATGNAENRDKLSEACSVVQRAVPSKSTIPALEGILLTARDGILTLSGYDMQMGIKTSISADIKKDGHGGKHFLAFDPVNVGFTLTKGQAHIPG